MRKAFCLFTENLKVRPGQRRFSQGGHGRSAETTMADAHVPAAEVDDIAYQRHKDLFRTFLDRPEVCTCGALPNPLAALCCADVDAAGVRARHMRAAALGGAPVVSAWACWRTLRARPCPCAAHFSARRLPAKPAPCPISHPPTSALAPTSPPPFRGAALRPKLLSLTGCGACGSAPSARGWVCEGLDAAPHGQLERPASVRPR